MRRLPVARRPRVALLASGDELVPPGAEPGPSQIIGCNNFAVAAVAEGAGAEVIDLGIFRDDLAELERAIGLARDARADVIVTLGGASVGDRDLLRPALARQGMTLDFWKIAMRPGKPFMYGRRKGQHVLGLPGNPVSSLVCARLFLKPLIDALLGLPAGDDLVEARLGASMKENDSRQDYVRAKLVEGPDGSRTVTPFAKQDSSMQRTFREAEALIVRPPHAKVAGKGDVVQILRLDF